MYKNFVKPVLDRLLALIFVLLFWWLYIILAIMVRVKLGSPVLFVQERPGEIELFYKTLLC
jgi:undecaprenyl phosphate N,N'-diacetylbacillosamine 1-phosphate transferase